MSFPPPSPKAKRLAGINCAFWLATIFCFKTFAYGQTASTAVPVEEGKPKLLVHKNALGMQFCEVPGTPVLFSTWETRVMDYEVFLRETKYNWSYKPHFPQTAEHPVVNVNLRDALTFCKWLTQRDRADGLINDLQSYRLPTNREWDAAVRLSSSRSKVDVAITQKIQDEAAFPWGVEWPPPLHAGNFNRREITGTEDGYVYTAPVGQFDPSPDGIYDLAGNAWEWAWDQENRPDASATLRGGSWMYFRKECLLSAYRYEVPGEFGPRASGSVASSRTNTGRPCSLPRRTRQPRKWTNSVSTSSAPSPA